MFATIRRYNVRAGQMSEVVKRVRQGLVPIVSRQAGFVSYHAIDAGDNVALSISFYQTRAAADAANKEAAAWVKANLAELITPIDVTVGEVVADAAARARSGGV
jgi:Antibiotic biosynthesis monooxygenase